MSNTKIRSETVKSIPPHIKAKMLGVLIECSKGTTESPYCENPYLEGKAEPEGIQKLIAAEYEKLDDNVMNMAKQDICHGKKFTKQQLPQVEKRADEILEAIGLTANSSHCALAANPHLKHLELHSSIPTSEGSLRRVMRMRADMLKKQSIDKPVATMAPVQNEETKSQATTVAAESVKIETVSEVTPAVQVMPVVPEAPHPLVQETKPPVLKPTATTASFFYAPTPCKEGIPSAGRLIATY